MIEKLECNCIEAYKTRNMRDPNCCACSCDHNDLVEQLAKANERVEELKKMELIYSEWPELTFKHVKEMFSDELNKFALEQKVIGAKDFHQWIIDYPESTIQDEAIQGYIQQLRKGGES